ncbi:MAG: hypothetical protein WAW36_08650 [Methylovulum miyakonense]|uniref:hypothetical protein n=1 Tax=Methylovulum miyakonense TaxID=645578 RepID=UPI003BB6EEE9
MVRLKHAIETYQLPAFSNDMEFVGVGAMPIWSPRVCKEINQKGGAGDVFYIVGDFRFGNAILNFDGFRSDVLPDREVGVIERDLINEENDKLMFDLCKFSINRLIDMPGNHRFLFWDLSIREYENRVNNRYLINNVYRHPVWNLSDVLAEYSEYAVDTSELLKYGRYLYIDSSAHPSFVGWACIFQYIENKKRVSVSNIIDSFDKELPVLLSGLTKNRKVILTGESIFTQNLSALLHQGNFTLPIGWHMSSIDKACQTLDKYDCCLYFPSLVTYKLTSEEIENKTKVIIDTQEKLKCSYKEVQTLFYDNWAYESVSKRKDFFGQFVSKQENGRTDALEAKVCCDENNFRISSIENFEAMLELNVTLIPTLLGLLEIFGRALGHFESEAIYDQYINLQHKVFNS